MASQPKSPRQTITRITDGGRLTLPADLRRRLGLQVGSNVVLRLRGKQIVLTNALDALHNAQKLIRDNIHTPRRSMAVELLADRRKEAAGE